MAMQLAALDILITKGGFAPESARAIGEAVDLEIERSRESLATGQQLTDTRLMLEDKLTDTRFELKAEIAAVLVKLEATKSEILRWMFAAMTGQTIVLVGLIRLLK
jgi:hypothetical protein